MKNRKLLTVISIIFVLSLSIFVFNQIYAGALPKIVEEINNGALGAIMTALVTVLLLSQQSESEEMKETNVKIFEKKIEVYSRFIEKLWTVLDDENVTEEELLELKKICFKELVFFLDQEQIKEITTNIKKLSGNESDIDDYQPAVAEISLILQKNLKIIKEDRKTNFIKFFNSFFKNKSSKEENEKKEDYSVIKLFNSFKKEPEISKEINKTETSTNEQLTTQTASSVAPINYWHFNALTDKQFEIFEKDNKENWILCLLEWGESWRTNLLKQVKTGDVVFLFKKGGYGYRGAFKVKGNKIFEEKEYKANKYESKEIEKYDIYNGMKEGASLVSCLIVEPIAYNYIGVGYKSVRRRTIERMNDAESVKYLITRFDGKELPENILKGQNKLDEQTQIQNINKDYFDKIVKTLNL